MLYDISKSFLLYINLCVLSFVCHVKMKNCYCRCNNPITGCQRNKIIFKYWNNMKRTYQILFSSVQQYLHSVYTGVLFIYCSFRSVLDLLFRNFSQLQFPVTFSNSDFPCWFQSLSNCFVPPRKVISMHMNPVD